MRLLSQMFGLFVAFVLPIGEPAPIAFFLSCNICNICCSCWSQFAKKGVDIRVMPLAISTE